MMDEKRKNDDKTPADAVVPAFVVIGIGLIFLLNLGIWPWILAVVAAASFAGLMLRGELNCLHMEGVLWTAGIFVIALTGFWWPGIIILVGLSMLLKAMAGAGMLRTVDDDEKRKRKRGLVPPMDDDRFV